MDITRAFAVTTKRGVEKRKMTRIFFLYVWTDYVYRLSSKYLLYPIKYLSVLLAFIGHRPSQLRNHED